MIEILPISHLTDEDALLFGKLNVSLSKLHRAGFPVAPGLVITPPSLHLKTTLEHFDFGHQEIFEQSLILVEKELEKIPVPENLKHEAKKHHKFLFNSQIVNSLPKLWREMLSVWIDQIKQRLWKDGFYPGITEDLDPQVVIFIKRSLEKPQPGHLKKIDELEEQANKKLFITHKYEWIIDGGVKLVKILPFTPVFARSDLKFAKSDLAKTYPMKAISAVKVFLDLSSSLIIEEDIDPDLIGPDQIGIGVDGVYIQSEKITDWEDLVFRIVESAITYTDKPVLVKLFGNTLEPPAEAILFARNKKNLSNVHVVIPYVRTTHELMQIKRDLAVKKLMRKNSLQVWLEVATPENIINLEEYLLTGIDGVVLNLDNLITYLVSDVKGLIKFLEDGLKLLHKVKVPFLVVGSICLEKEVLEFLIEKGVYGIIVAAYEAHSARDLFHQTEAKHILSLGSF